MIEIGIGCMIGVLVCATCYFAWQFHRLKKDMGEQIQLYDLIPFQHDGLYFYDVLHHREWLSPSMRQLIPIPCQRSDSVFESLGACFCDQEHKKLRRYYEEIRASKRDKDIWVRPSIHLELQNHMTGKKFTVQCMGQYVDQTYPKREGVVLAFRDVSEHKQQLDRLHYENDKLKTQLKRMHSIINVVSFPIWVRQRDSLNIFFCNPAYSKLLEHESEKAVGVEGLELDKQSLQFAKRAKESGEPEQEQRRIIAGNKRLWYWMEEVPVKDSNIQVGYGLDITRQQELKHELSQHVSAHSDLLESSGSAMAIYGRDRRLQFFNQSFTKLWGIDEKWLYTKPTYEEMLDHLRSRGKLPEQANYQSFKEGHMKLFTTLIETYNEFLYLPDGRAFRVIVIPHALGGLLFAYEDMTDRLALERSYNTLIAVQNATLDNLHEAVAVFNENGRLKLSNAPFSKLWQLRHGYLGEEPHIGDILEKCRDHYRHRGSWESYKEKLIRMIMDRKMTKKRLVRSDESVIDRVCVPLPDGATLVSDVDVTDSTLVERSLREKNDALQDADRIKTEFLANVSYELRSPLTSIMGLSEVLTKQYFGGLNKQQKEYVDGIYTSSQYLMILINDILDLASIEAGYLKLEVEHFDLYGAISSVILLIQERLKELDISLRVECAPNFGMVEGDERRIKQVLFKLLSNAMEYSRAGETVTLSIQSLEEQKFVMIVKDEGVGISAEEKEYIFDKFYKTEYARASKKSGAGLGLAMVKSFIELHGGSIALESELGKGTAVHCTLSRYYAGKSEDKQKTSAPMIQESALQVTAS